MSEDAKGSARPPVNLKGLQERVLLQAELMGHDAQLRNFAPLRDRLVASGQDANAMYRQIESRRDLVMGELKKLTLAPVRPVAADVSFRPLRRGSVLSLPIAPARFHPSFPDPWFGFSGTVQMGRANEGVEVYVGPDEHAGSIYTVALNDTGGILWAGSLAAGNESGKPYDPSYRYFWIHNWDYLIPFPAPVVKSTFTYSFEVDVLAAITLNNGGATLMSFITVGETANFVGQEIVANKGAGWPLIADLEQPDANDGIVQGHSFVQQSFVVEAGHVPAVALVLGMVSAQAMRSDVIILDEFGSHIIPGSNTGGRRDGVVNFHYEPMPPVAHPGPL